MADYFINKKSGNNGNTGLSFAQAWADFANIGTPSDNDNIYIYDGVYSDNISYITDLNLYGIGYVELSGQCNLNNTSQYADSIDIYNIIFTNSVLFAQSANAPYRTLIQNCKFVNCDVGFEANYNFTVTKNCVLINCNIGFNQGVSRQIGIFHSQYTTFINCIGINLHDGSGDFVTKNNIFISCQIHPEAYNNDIDSDVIDTTNNLYNSKIIFDGTDYGGGEPQSWNWAAAPVATSASQLRSQYLTENGVASPVDFETLFFINPAFIDTTYLNYNLEHGNSTNDDLIENKIGFTRGAIGWLCNSTDFSLYSSDTYSIGITNVTGAIDDVNQKLYRTASGAANYAVFAGVAKGFDIVQMLKFMDLIGIILGTGQISKNPADFSNYQVDVLWKLSAILTPSELESDTGLTFKRLKYNKKTKLQEDGTYGDGDLSYTPGNGQRIIAKSAKPIVIIRDSGISSNDVEINSISIDIEDYYFFDEETDIKTQRQQKGAGRGNLLPDGVNDAELNPVNDPEIAVKVSNTEMNFEEIESEGGSNPDFSFEYEDVENDNIVLCETVVASGITKTSKID